jgi:5-methylcytosine-specific restriction enzyme A
MPKIGLVEIAAAYQLSREVSDGKLTDLQAAQKLQNSYGMNFSSAWGYLRKRGQMLRGEQYTRTMNIAATRYYLENIYSDEGEQGLTSALTAVRAHAAYYNKQGKSGLPSITALVDELENQYLLNPAEESVCEWQAEVAAAYKMSKKQRQARLPKQGHKPKKYRVLTYAFSRSPHVVAERLRIADGRCEECHNLAPFVCKADGLPYLEVHHRVTLADDGDDTVENSIALCPNCHRRRHYG